MSATKRCAGFAALAGAFMVLIMGAGTAGAQDTLFGYLDRYYEAPDTNVESSMPYRLYVPESYDPSREYPCCVYLHGHGLQGDGNYRHIAYQVWKTDKVPKKWVSDSVQADHPCFVIAPQCPVNELWVNPINWSQATYDMSTRDIAPALRSVKSILERTIDEYAIDTTRIYATGLSLGAIGTYDLVMRYPSRFAAIMTMCGMGDASNADRIAHMGVWAFHGSGDDEIPVEGSRVMIDSLRAACEAQGMDTTHIKYTEYPDTSHYVYAHVMDTEDEWIDWIFSQRLGGVDIQRPVAHTDYMRIHNASTPKKYAPLLHGSRVHGEVPANAVLMDLLGRRVAPGGAGAAAAASHAPGADGAVEGERADGCYIVVPR